MQQEFITPLEIGLKRGEEIGLRKGEAIGLRKGEEIGLRKGMLMGEMRGIIRAMCAQKASHEAIEKQLMKLYHLSMEEANLMIDTMADLD